MFGRVNIFLDAIYTNFNANFRNCVFYGGIVDLERPGTNTWVLKNNLFDGTAITTNGTYTADYNGYTTNLVRLPPWGANDVLLSVANITYDVGALGRYYLPTNLTSHSVLFNKGSTNANYLGLYHFTTTTNQVKETNSVVDIGFHYVAGNSSGQPIDNDGDGLPNYYEDANGNGSVDGGETDWQTYNSLFGIGSGPGLLVFTPLK